jgi:hypothetical protein
LKLGRCCLQIRPLGVKTSQYRTPNRNRPRKENVLCAGGAVRSARLTGSRSLTRGCHRPPAIERHLLERAAMFISPRAPFCSMRTLTCTTSTSLRRWRRDGVPFTVIYTETNEDITRIPARVITGSPAARNQRRPQSRTTLAVAFRTTSQEGILPNYAPTTATSAALGSPAGPAARVLK